TAAAVVALLALPAAHDALHRASSRLGGCDAASPSFSFQWAAAQSAVATTSTRCRVRCTSSAGDPEYCAAKASPSRSTAHVLSSWPCLHVYIQTGPPTDEDHQLLQTPSSPCAGCFRSAPVPASRHRPPSSRCTEPPAVRRREKRDTAALPK